MPSISRRTAVSLLAAAPLSLTAAPSRAGTATVPLGYDKDGRPTAPVLINGKGPFSLVADTAAGGSALTPALAQELKLAADPNADVAVRGASGQSSVQLFNLDSLKVGDFEVKPAFATSLPNAGISDSRGVLGADVFLRAGRVEFDFEAGRLSLGESRAPASPGWSALKAELTRRIFAIVRARVGDIELPALVDSGARGTLANLKLMAAMGYAQDDARLALEAKPTGATGHVMRTWTGASARVDLAGQVLADQRLVFAELPVFGPLGLDEGPALLLGIDTLRRFGAVAVDYPRSEVQFRPRR
ncbi:MAG: aspartyl protease family protein [Caulobacteraceae bacterium]|nr:aspartyl protease family protein [Caulobacteraceae bacterium]